MNVRKIALLSALTVTLLLGACRHGASGGPRVRFASYPTATTGTHFIGPEIGEHSYKHGASEKNGIAYTCHGGHIDFSHLRKASDWTLFLAYETLEHLRQGQTEFSFRLYEPSRYFVTLTYPEHWEELSAEQKEPVIHDMAIRMGQYFAFTATTWHEMLSWFGYRSTRIFPEFASAFSWEDSYSNLLGTYIAAQALQNTTQIDIADTNEFDQIMTVALDMEFEKLEIQSGSVAKRAASSVRGEWFSGDLFMVNMKKRHFDIGVDDGYVSPVITYPDCETCDSSDPIPYPVPNLDFLVDYGFGIKFEIELREGVKNKILKAAYSDPQGKYRIEPDVHFARIIDYIETLEAERNGTVPSTDTTTTVAHGGPVESAEPVLNDPSSISRAVIGPDINETGPIDFGDSAVVSSR